MMTKYQTIPPRTLALLMCGLLGVPTLGCDDATNATAGDPCTAREITCSSMTTLDICLDDGRSHVLVPCPGGQMCSAGACVLTPTQECTPDSTSCASSLDVAICDADGMGRTLSPCGVGEVCSAGACVDIDAPGACAIGGIWCDPNGDVRRCNATGTGFETAPCATGTTCTPGRGCEGDACVVGETRCAGQSTLARCVDGSAWVAEECELGCSSYDGTNSADAAVCVTEGECLAGMRVCGDHRDASVDQTAGYLQCELVGERLTWVRYQCGAGTECGPGLSEFIGEVALQFGQVERGGVLHESLEPRCIPSAGCVPGTERCGPTGQLQRCDGARTWGADMTCETDTTCLAGTHPFSSLGTDLVLANFEAVCHDDPCVQLVQDHAADVYSLWAQSDGSITVGVCQPGVNARAIDTCSFSRSLSTGDSCRSSEVCEPFILGGSFGACVPAPAPQP